MPVRSLLLLLSYLLTLPFFGLVSGARVVAQTSDSVRAVTPHDPEHSVNATEWCGLHAARNELVQGFSDCTYALAVNPDDAQALSNRASIYIVVKEPRAALADLDRAIAVKPGQAILHFNRGVAHSDLNHAEAAIADYSEALRLNPEMAIALYNRGWEYEKRGARDLAIADYEASLTIKPDLAQAKRRLERLLVPL